MELMEDNHRVEVRARIALNLAGGGGGGAAGEGSAVQLLQNRRFRFSALLAGFRCASTAKVKHLEYEHKNNLTNIASEGESGGGQEPRNPASSSSRGQEIIEDGAHRA